MTLNRSLSLSFTGCKIGIMVNYWIVGKPRDNAYKGSSIIGHFVGKERSHYLSGQEVG